MASEKPVTRETASEKPAMYDNKRGETVMSLAAFRAAKFDAIWKKVAIHR